MDDLRLSKWRDGPVVASAMRPKLARLVLLAACGVNFGNVLLQMVNSHRGTTMATLRHRPTAAWRLTSGRIHRANDPSGRPPPTTRPGSETEPNCSQMASQSRWLAAVLSTRWLDVRGPGSPSHRPASTRQARTAGSLELAHRPKTDHAATAHQPRRIDRGASKSVGGPEPIHTGETRRPTERF